MQARETNKLNDEESAAAAVLATALKATQKAPSPEAEKKNPTDPRHTYCEFCKTKHSKANWGTCKKVTSELSGISLKKCSLRLAVDTWICESAYKYLVGETDIPPASFSDKLVVTAARSHSDIGSLSKGKDQQPTQNKFMNFRPSSIAAIAADYHKSSQGLTSSAEGSLKRQGKGDNMEALKKMKLSEVETQNISETALNIGLIIENEIGPKMDAFAPMYEDLEKTLHTAKERLDKTKQAQKKTAERLDRMSEDLKIIKERVEASKKKRVTKNTSKILATKLIARLNMAITEIDGAGQVKESLESIKKEAENLL